MSESSSTGTTYEVFLSFRGPDTRQGFTDVLYHALVDAGIRVFRDNEEIREGEEIGGEILAAIEDSKILVPVFSRGYASSKWCLRELVRMVESKDQGSPSGTKKIVPIFYDVTPDDVQLNTKLYADALAVHLKLQLGSEEIQQWEDTLKKVARIKGSELKATGYAEFAKDFARKISMKLKVKQKYVNGSLVWRSHQQDALVNLLDAGSTREVRFVWIHGMGGIGKTTIAKVVYNLLCDQFNSCSFLLDIREMSKRKGIEHLQRQLLQDLDVKAAVIKDENDGIGVISEKLKKKKVLIVLDDVYDQEQVRKLAGEASWFGDGSRIIITSRNKRVPEFRGGRVEILEAEPMNFEESLLLFSRHAFGQDSPPYDFRDLTEKVVRVTRGLPLALEVIGSQLQGHCHHGWWDRIIDNLDKIPPEKVKERLRISYDSLNWEAKKIFLDIACFFINEEKTKPMYMWHAWGIVADLTVEELINRSLVKIIDNDKFWMHDQLRDLGRSIVREATLKDPRKPSSRIWMPEDALKVLGDEEGKESVDMLRVSAKLSKFSGTDQGCILTEKELKSFKNLRFLSLQKSKFSGDLQDVLPKLTWLSWHCCPTRSWGTNLCLQNLVVLDLSESDIGDDWIGWRQIGMCKELKVLDLKGCYNLTRTPDLSECVKLERLVLQNCISLVEIHHSVGKLQRLKYLNATWCESLAEIPEELSCLDGVEKMVTKVYDHLSNLLETFSILTLPDSIGRLLRIKHLSVCLGMSRLPDSLGDLRTLTRLDLSRSNMVELPQSIGGLVRLEFLSLHFCKKIEKLPDSIGHLTSLVELDISWSAVAELPSTIGNLNGLKVINMKGSVITNLPSSVQNLKKLEKLDAEHCCCLHEIPPEVERLGVLKF